MLCRAQTPPDQSQRRGLVSRLSRADPPLTSSASVRRVSRSGELSPACAVQAERDPARPPAHRRIMSHFGAAMLDARPLTGSPAQTWARKFISHDVFHGASGSAFPQLSGRKTICKPLVLFPYFDLCTLLRRSSL